MDNVGNFTEKLNIVELITPQWVFRQYTVHKIFLYFRPTSDEYTESDQYSLTHFKGSSFTLKSLTERSSFNIPYTVLTRCTD